MTQLAEGSAVWIRHLQTWKRPLFGLLGVVGVLSFWEVAARAEWIDSLLLSSPSSILDAFKVTFTNAGIVDDIKISAIEVALGLGLAAAVGVTVGIVSGLNRWVYFAVDPWLTILYALPIVALAPLIVNIVGIGLAAKVLLIFLFAVFPIAVNTLTGVHATSTQYLNVATVYRANRWMVIRSVVVPGSLPFVLTGLRLAGGRALVGMVVAEFTASDSGIGFRIQQAAASLQTGVLMALLIILGIAGVLYSATIRWLDNRLSEWRPDQKR